MRHHIRWPAVTPMILASLAACSAPPLPVPTPNRFATSPLDATCRSPVSSRRWRHPYGSPTPAIALTNDQLAGEYDVTVVITDPVLPDSDATSSGPMELWSQERVRRYRKAVRLSDKVVLIGTERIPLLDPGGGIGIGLPAEDSTSADARLATTPSIAGSRTGSGVHWDIGLGLDRGWLFYVLQGDSTRLVGRWYTGGEEGATRIEGYFCAVRRSAGA